MRASRPACHATTISTGRARRAPAISSSPRARAAAGRPRVGYLRQARTAAQSRGGDRTRWPAASCSRAAARSASSTGSGGTTHTARAGREVILAGGAFNSPQLLQLSGVGPAALLRSHGIDVVADMPGVGADLQDHSQVRMQYRCTEPITMNDVINSWRHADRRRAALRAVPQGLADDRRRLCRRLLPAPIASGNARRAGPFHHCSRPRRSARQLHPFPGFIASVCQLRPESRGFVRIKSADPAQAPAIQPRYLTASRPRHGGCRHEAVAPRSWQQPAMQRYIAEERRAGRRSAPATRELLAFARATGHHGIPSDQHLPHGPDATAVVDERLRVHGIAGSARRRRLDHADGRVRQHQRRRRDDRREGRRHDPAGCGCRCCFARRHDQGAPGLLGRIVIEGGGGLGFQSRASRSASACWPVSSPPPRPGRHFSPRCCCSRPATG